MYIKDFDMEVIIMRYCQKKLVKPESDPTIY